MEATETPIASARSSWVVCSNSASVASLKFMYALPLTRREMYIRMHTCSMALLLQRSGFGFLKSENLRPAVTARVATEDRIWANLFLSAPREYPHNP